MLKALTSIAALAEGAGALAELNSTNPVAAWTQVNDGPWSKREGLMGVEYKGALYMSGGRTSFGAGFSDEIWRSEDTGKSWVKASSGVVPSRAYHNHLVVGDCMIIFGGQTFTTFYNDVWQSCDGKGEKWERITEHAEFPARAGASATVTKDGAIIVAGGCYNKNTFPWARSFWGDVYKSTDGGKSFSLMTNNPGWKARSGPRLIETKSGKLLIVAGEVGFTTDTQLVDVWSSSDDGASWEVVAEEPGFSPRSGHGVVVNEKGEIIVIAGWPHLHDLHVSNDEGKSFQQVANDVWNCNSESCGKFDFWPIMTSNNEVVTIGGSGAYSTFGTLWQDTWVAQMASSTQNLHLIV